MDFALKSDLAERVESDDSRKDNSIRELTKGIETSLSLLEDIRKPDYKPEDPENLKLNIEAHEASITDYQARIKRLSTEHYPIDMGIPDSAAYQSGGILHGYLWREGRLYCFDKGFDRIPTAEDKNEFIQFVKAFRVRKLYEIPKEPGICLPYGFVPDDGKTQYTVSVSIRFKDRPNVVWNFNTGPVESQPADFGISSDALTNIGFMQDLPNIPGRKVLAVKDEPIQIGALMARQWGAVVTLRPYQNLPFLETYEFSIYRRGVEGSQMLPYMAIHMRGIGKEFDDILKTQPPPYKETKARQETLFKSIRIRPTTPLMPELAAIQ
jgi:hypothetical protein